MFLHCMMHSCFLRFDIHTYVRGWSKLWQNIEILEDINHLQTHINRYDIVCLFKEVYDKDKPITSSGMDGFFVKHPNILLSYYLSYKPINYYDCLLPLNTRNNKNKISLGFILATYY